MTLTRRRPMPEMAPAPFDSFYHRHTPHWYHRRALLLAFASAMALGGFILSSTLSVMG